MGRPAIRLRRLPWAPASNAGVAWLSGRTATKPPTPDRVGGVLKRTNAFLGVLRLVAPH